MLAFWYDIRTRSFIFILRIKVICSRPSFQVRMHDSYIAWLHFMSWATTWHLGCTSCLGLLHGILAAFHMATLHVLGYYMASWLHFMSWATTWNLGCISCLGLLHGILAALHVLGLVYMAS